MTDLGTDLVEIVYKDHLEVVEYLRDLGEISHLATLERTFPKVMLLAAASNLEHKIQEILDSFYGEVTRNTEVAVSFVRNKAIKRQYHSYFNWDGINANSFFGLFGENFKDVMKEELKTDLVFNQSIRDFLEVGFLRNQLVHGDYGSFILDKSALDLLTQYRSAAAFVVKFREILHSQISD
ncbi:HEPN domain-containing protein [Rhodococcus sp. SJ-2]